MMVVHACMRRQLLRPRVHMRRGRMVAVMCQRGRRRRRPKNTKPLQDYIMEVLQKNPKGLRVREIADAVLKAGYKTNSDNFYNIVAGALKDKQFKRLSRGVYGVKK
jgi:hypothetical protein